MDTEFCISLASQEAGLFIPELFFLSRFPALLARDTTRREAQLVIRELGADIN